MPTRTFIGLILMVVLLLVAATPALMEPVTKQVVTGLDAAGMPGMDAGEAERVKGKSKGDVKNELRLKGYDAVKGDMVDRYPEGQRDIHNSRRLTAGTSRADLPGYFELNPDGSPTSAIKGGMLLDVNKCPVFREGSDLQKIWDDKDQKKRYTDKAKAASDPKKCLAHLEDQVAKGEIDVDQPAMREISKWGRSNDLSLAISMSYAELLNEFFGIEDGDDSLIKLRRNIRTTVESELP